MGDTNASNELPIRDFEVHGFDALDLRAQNILSVNFNSDDHDSSAVTYLAGTTLRFSQIERVIPCFTPGTGIATPRGQQPAETLKVGDRILTRDNGIQYITWAGQKTMTVEDLDVSRNMRPVMIRRGALGNDLPERDMVVSPNHRVLLVSQHARTHFGESEVLAAAKSLTMIEGIDSIILPSVTYIHFMCENHEVVLSEGAWTETFQPSDYSLQGIDVDQREELFLLFPELATREGLKQYRAARRTLNTSEAQQLRKGD